MKTKILCFTLLVEKSPQALPLGAACIASALKNDVLTKDLCDVLLRSFSLEDEDFSKVKNGSDFQKGSFFAEKILKILDRAQDSIVCFSVFVWNRPILEEISKILKSHGIITVAGGPEITARPEAFANFDYKIAGEGENNVPSLIYKIVTKKSPENRSAGLPDLNKISSPYLDGTLDVNEFGGALWELARGCPFKCSYCYESKGEKTVRLFPMERIKKELDLFAQKKVPQVFVLDPTYNADKKRAIEILNLIAQKTPDTFYYFEARAEFIDREMAKAFTKIPCAIQIGLQTANEEVAKAVHRPFNRKIFVKNINYLNQSGAIFGLDLIYGLPLDTLKSFKESVDFATSLYPNNLEIFCLSVLPGTDLYDRSEELKLTFQSEPPYHVIHTDRFSVQDLETARKIAQGCSVFYNAGRAVPWFNTICKAAKIKANQFFLQFYDWLTKEKQTDCDFCCKMKQEEVENLQLEFIKNLFYQKNIERLFKAASDIIIFNGAVSRKTDTGKDQFIKLNYPVDYVDSEYSLNLEFFVQNVKEKPGKLKI